MLVLEQDRKRSRLINFPSDMCFSKCFSSPTVMALNLICIEN